jgi:hypothetical protein
MLEPSGEPLAGDPEPVSAAVKVQIFATEHWGLLATRSMIWNEIFTRTGMVLTTLSAAAVAIALVAQASDFGQGFRIFALLVLPIVLLLGLGTAIRLGAALEEDVALVMGMNRLRRACLDLAPDLERYFITSAFDDILGIFQSYSGYGRPMTMGVTPSRVLSSAAAIVGILDCVLVGIIVALLVNLVDDRSGVYVTAGVVDALLAAVVVTAIVPYRTISRVLREYQPRFRRP